MINEFQKDCVSLYNFEYISTFLGLYLPLYNLECFLTFLGQNYSER